MSNPRKFSEKIALHTQKQLEEVAAFEQIMKEVKDVRPFGGVLIGGPQSGAPQQILQNQQENHLNITNYRGVHGGSLPNVNQMAQGEKGLHSSRGCSGHPPSSSPRSQKGSIGPVRIKPSHNNRETSPYASPPSASMLSNSMSTTTAGGFGSSGYSGRSSYAPSSYLSPPIDSSCRRFNSDSALNLNTLLIPSTVPDSSEDSSNNSNDYSATGLNCNRGPAHAPIAIANLSRTRDPHGSLLEIPPVPVSMSSTGSLPDLTNFQYPPPLQLPMDPDDQQNHSPYSTSPLTGSSITYSPTSSHASPQGAGNGQPQQRQLPQSPHSPGSHTPQQSFNENPNPLHVNTSFQNYSNDNMLSTYRCPQRPSPQNSPSPAFQSASPLDGQHSGPSSPIQGQTTQPNEYCATQQAQALQQYFEQISVQDRTQKHDYSSMNRQWRQGTNAGGPYLYSPQCHPNTGAAAISQSSPQHPQPQTPQTPSSIPDIIFTDFSDPRGTDQFQLEEILASEQMQAAFRDGLGQIDFDGFQMLDQPDLVQLDPQVEDSFRLDRL